ncbi:tetratricopeptide repeat protein [Alphaproteobacteria bacterium]|nr:tetratricopeptide repeat protein [Alphaproteobacteria bacterium]
MSDIFQEIDNELRRDRLSRFWDQNGLVIIVASVALVLVVAVSVIFSSWRASQNEASSERYEQLLERLDDASIDEKVSALEAFIREEDRGYKVLSQMRLAALMAESGDYETAARMFEEVSANGQLPLAVRDYATLQAGAALVSVVAPADIEVRLSKILQNQHGMRGQAREILALSYLLADQPLQARDLLLVHLDTTAVSQAMKLRANILLDEALKKLQTRDQ